MNETATQTDLTHFVILMPWGRVGSNLLTNILRQSKKFKLANEPMTGIKSRNRQAGEAEIARLQMEWFNEFFDELSNNGESGGAKLSMASVADRDAFVRGLQDRGLRMIYMDRRNLVKTAISILKAEIYAERHKEKFGNPSWAVRPGREIKEKTVIDIPKFTKWLKVCQENQEKMRTLSQEVPGLDIYYEDIMFDIDGVITEALEFLSVEPFDYEIPFVKAVSDDLESEIENYSDVLTSLTSDEHREMLAGLKMKVKSIPISFSILTALLLFNLVAPNSSYSQSTKTESTPSQKTIEVESKKTGKFDTDDIDESSGIIASRNHPDKFWTHNDNGDDLRLFLIDSAGKLHGVACLTGGKARDVEDISCYEFEGRSHIVLGDIGDNAFRRKTCGLLIFEEPELKLKKEKVVSKDIDKITHIEFAYEDGSRNCEAMAVDSQRQEVWLTTKESLAGPLSPKKRKPAFYRLSIADLQKKQKEPLTARKIAPLLDPLATGMDFSHDNMLAVIRTYTYARLYRRTTEQTWEEVFESGDSEMFGLPTQIQGEAICFFQDGKALLTTSEQKGQPIWQVQLPTGDSDPK